MSKRGQKKGFIFVETIVVIAFLATILLSIYTSFNNVLENSKTRLAYDDPIYTYRTYYLLNYLEQNNIIDYINAKFNNANDLEIFEFGCNAESVLKNEDARNMCSNIKNDFEINHIFIMPYNVNKIVECAESTSSLDMNLYCLHNTSLQNLSVGAVNYLYTLDGYTGPESSYTDKRYRIVVEFKKSYKTKLNYYIYDTSGKATEKEQVNETKYKYYYTTLEIPFGIDDRYTYEQKQIENDPTVLYNIINNKAVLDNKQSPYVSSTTGILFSKVSSSTNGQGVYTLSSTSTQNYPIRYYRGNVNDNNVIFGNFCWKIVRTTDKGGTKLIYNGKPSGGKCNNSGTASQINTAAFNTKHTSVAYAGYMYGDVYESKLIDMTNLNKEYSNYDHTTGKFNYYYLTNAYFANKEAISSHFGNTDLFANSGTSIDASEWATKYTSVSNPNGLRYTRIDGRVVSYSYGINYVYAANSQKIWYIELKGNPTIPLNTPQEALAEMTTESSNTTSSTIKDAIDTWYESNLNNYTKYLEDSIWCNDRGISTYAGWKEENNASVQSGSNPLYFSGQNRLASQKKPSLSCPQNDSFSVDSSIGNGKLKYPVGLLTADEVVLAGGLQGDASAANTNYYLHTGENWWTMTPYLNFFDMVCGFAVLGNGSMSYNYESFAFGVRPTITLKHSARVTSGVGTENDPYKIYDK